MKHNPCIPHHSLCNICVLQEALAHPYLSTLHCPEDEPNHISKFDFSFEMGIKLDKITLQRLMYEEITALKRGKAPLKLTYAPSMPPQAKPPTPAKEERKENSATTSTATTAGSKPVGSTSMCADSGVGRVYRTTSASSNSSASSGDKSMGIQRRFSTTDQDARAMPKPTGSRLPIGPEFLGRNPADQGIAMRTTSQPAIPAAASACAEAAGEDPTAVGVSRGYATRTI